MLDPRFYTVLSDPTVADVVAITGGFIRNGDPNRVITGLAACEDAQSGDLTFRTGKDSSVASGAQAAACLVPPDAASQTTGDAIYIICDDPRGAFSQAAKTIAARIELSTDVGNIHPSASIAAGAVIEPGAVIGARAAIGDETRIGAGSIVGPGVQIGRGCRIGANSTIYCCLIGDRVTIFPGAVLGENGFGLPNDASALIGHFGRVIIQDDVSIGANTCIDRGMLGDTTIGSKTHIDNLCHIGHNVSIGSGVRMAAFAGVSGSSGVADQVMFGGRVGLSDHVTVGQGARIAAGAAVLQDVPAGETWAGYPAKPIKGWMRELAWLRRAAQKRPGGGR